MSQANSDSSVLSSPPPPPKVKRVLMSADTLGGVWTYALELARALDQQGVEVAIATMGRLLSPHQCQEAGGIPGLEIFESHYKLEWMADPWSDLEQADNWLLNLEAQLQPDIVHLNTYVQGALPWRAPVLVVGHSCVCSWWQAVKGQPAPAAWQHYAQQVRTGLQGADWVVAPSQAMLAELQRYYGPLPPTTVIPNSRNPSQFRPGKKQDRILSVGRLWDEAKNLNALEQVATELSWPVYVAGEVAHPVGGTVQTRRVRPLGHLAAADLASWLGSAAIYTLPARYEPFGLSVLEAALAGCALVLGDIPSLRENWQGAALFVSPEEPPELQSALLRLIAEPPLRQALAQKAQDRARSFTPEQMAARYLAIYAELQTQAQLPPKELPCKS